MKATPNCPRCKGWVNTEAEFPTCVECGWVNYSINRRPLSIVPSGEPLIRDERPRYKRKPDGYIRH